MHSPTHSNRIIMTMNSSHLIYVCLKLNVLPDNYFSNFQIYPQENFCFLLCEWKLPTYYCRFVCGLFELNIACIHFLLFLRIQVAVQHANHHSAIAITSQPSSQPARMLSTIYYFLGKFSSRRSCVFLWFSRIYFERQSDF